MRHQIGLGPEVEYKRDVEEVPIINILQMISKVRELDVLFESPDKDQ